jgi:ankyrin repeat protein
LGRINEEFEGGEYGMALQAASYAGHPEIVRLLVENGAEVDARGEVLFRLSADIINILPEGGEFGTALRAASAGSKPQEIQNLLIAYGADPTL